MPLSAPSITFSITEKVSTSMKVLMHHADAGGDRVLRAADPLGLAVDADLAGIPLVEAVEDAHEGGFAGAVLADDAVDRALGDLHGDIAVGTDRAEAFVDADQLDRRNRSGRRGFAAGGFGRV